MIVKFPSKICFKAVGNLHHAIQCDNCKQTQKINTQTYNLLLISSAALHCIRWSEEIYPFLNISNEELFETNQGKNIKFKVFTQKNYEQNIDLIDTLNKAVDYPDYEIMTGKSTMNLMKFPFYFQVRPPKDLSSI